MAKVEAETAMWKIVLATDGSEVARGATEFLAALPLPDGAEIRGVSVIGPLDEGYYQERPALQPIWQERQRMADAALAGARALLEREGVKFTTSTPSGETAHEIILAAREFNADLLVVGSRVLTGLQGFLLGSVARNIAKHAPCSVLVARAPRVGVRRIVLAMDESEHAWQALELAAQLPLPVDARIAVVHVLRPENPVLGLMAIESRLLYDALQEAERQDREKAEQRVESARSRLSECGRDAGGSIRIGDPAAEIMASVDEQNADLIVAGARGTSLIQGLLVGSVADRLLNDARCSVLIVRSHSAASSNIDR